MIALLAAATLAAAPAPVSTATPAPTSPAAAPDADATRILAGAARGDSYPILAELTDGVGARLAGSPGAAAAVQWAEAWFRKAGIPVRLQPVQVNHWVRGEERAEVLAAPGRRAQPLAVTALGNSAPTPPSGLEGEVVEVGSLEELAALGEKVKGRIVIFQHDMKVSSDYGRASRLRMRGPDAAARQGAVAALVRSASTASFRLPHTGATVFQPGTAPIPAAALATEDAELLHRLLAAGPVRVRLVLGGRTAEPPLAPSANVIA
ncbi:MAG TPA: hypothetical protein VFM45_08355 [Anaeromyxobacteraceae bacterium]|nr:hypothetical protein [Anaeromyxobacteraceae bacterium]